MGFPQKRKIELPSDPVIPLLGIYPKKMKTLVQKDTHTHTHTHIYTHTQWNTSHPKIKK